MERTESTVVQVAPDYENAKIEEMQMFGWSLQSRQEIHEEGDAYGRPSFLFDDEYIVKTKVYHYVKLHFVRSLGLPNLHEIRQLESKYFGPEPSFPRLVPGGGCLLLFWYPLWPLYYLLSYRKKKAAAHARLRDLFQTRREVSEEVRQYLK